SGPPRPAAPERAARRPPPVPPIRRYPPAAAARRFPSRSSNPPPAPHRRIVRRRRTRVFPRVLDEWNHPPPSAAPGGLARRARHARHRIVRMDTSVNAGAILYALADSRLPIGGHVHSGGVEEAVASGLVRDLATVEAYLRRRITTSGLVAASLAAAVCAGELTETRADGEADARTPAPAARAASRAQGRGLVRLAKQIWPHEDWTRLSPRPHLSTAFGAVGAVAGIAPADLAGIAVYTT